MAASAPCQTPEMDYSESCQTSVMQKWKLKTAMLDVWEGSEYASELAFKYKLCIFKSIWISRVTDNLLGKIKKKEQNEL